MNYYFPKLKKWHIVVSEKNDVDRLKALCQSDHVRRFAFIKHSRSFDGRPHYHFYIELKAAVDELGLEDLADVPCYKAYPVKASEDVVLGYILKGFTVDDLQSGIFFTNIRKFTCYNAVQAL